MGTDWPLSWIDPWVGFEAMITRQNPLNRDPALFHGGPITLKQALFDSAIRTVRERSGLPLVAAN